MVEWHLGLNGQFEQTLGDNEEQGSLYALVHGVTKSRTQLSKWITTKSEKEEVKPLLCTDDKALGKS